MGQHDAIPAKPNFLDKMLAKQIVQGSNLPRKSINKVKKLIADAVARRTKIAVDVTCPMCAAGIPLRRFVAAEEDPAGMKEACSDGCSNPACYARTRTWGHNLHEVPADIREYMSIPLDAHDEDAVVPCPAGNIHEILGEGMVVQQRREALLAQIHAEQN